MTTLEELNQRESEELRLVREKYAKLRNMVPHVCELNEDLLEFSQFVMTQETRECKHCGAAMEEV